jgi:stage II sporulation protein AB (anti-sigma F factor)
MGQAAYWKHGETCHEPEDGQRNEMYVKLLAVPENEQLSRMVVGAFISALNPTLEELNDVKTAVSEAVTNAIIHGYYGMTGDHFVELSLQSKGDELSVCVTDNGVGIEDVERAMEPMYTTKPELERSGMGFAFMEAFMDEVRVVSSRGEGVRVYMKRTLHKELLNE